MIFRPLASSSAGCAYLLSGGGAPKPLLIEAGIPRSALLKATNYQLSSCAGCVVSHCHGDHAMAVGPVSAAGVDVYASKETWEAIPSVPSHRKHFIAPRVETMIGHWIVLPFEAVHDAPGTLGFVIGSPHGERLLYLTDSCYAPFTFADLTHIAVECNHSSEIIRERTRDGTIHAERYKRTVRTHMSLERLLEMLKANDLRQVEEIHLLHLSSANSDEAAFKLAVERATGKPVYVAAEVSH